MLYRRWKSSNITDQQSFLLILFLDVVSRCSVPAIYSCFIFCQNRLPSGMWLLPWHLMTASVDILFKGLPSIPFRTPLPSFFSPSHSASPSTLLRVCHAVTFSQRAHSDLVHRQSCWCELCGCEVLSV